MKSSQIFTRKSREKYWQNFENFFTSIFLLFAESHTEFCMKSGLCWKYEIDGLETRAENQKQGAVANLLKTFINSSVTLKFCSGAL